MRARIFWYFRILKNRSDDVIILRSVKNGHFGQKIEEKHKNDSRDDDNLTFDQNGQNAISADFEFLAGDLPS